MGIVGGGPAGGCFAGRIREAFGDAAKIVVFEKKGEVGGQSQTSDTTGIIQEKGTRYLLKTPPISTKYDEVMEFLSKHADTKFYAIPNPSLFNGNASSRAEPGTSTAAKDIDALMQAYASVATYERGGSEYHFARAAYDSLHSLSVSNPTIQKWYDVALNGQVITDTTTPSRATACTRGSKFQGITHFGAAPVVYMVTGGWQPAWKRLLNSVGAETRVNSTVKRVRASDPTLGIRSAVVLETGGGFLRRCCCRRAIG